MKNVVDWLQVNKLSLNLKKTHFMLFRKRRKIVLIEWDLAVNDTIISMVDKTNFLGVVVDECLTFLLKEKFLDLWVFYINVRSISKLRLWSGLEKILASTYPIDPKFYLTTLIFS